MVDTSLHTRRCNMTLDNNLLAQKIKLEGQWNSEYAENGYTLNLLEIEKQIREVKRKMVFQDHNLAKREIKSPEQNFAVAS